MVFDPATILVYVELAGKFVKVGKALVADLRTAVADDPEANLKVLDDLDADYAHRISRREDDV